MAKRHGVDDVAAEPAKVMPFGKLVDVGRRLARVDRAADERDAGWRSSVAISVHQGCCDENRDCGLAYREHVRARSQQLQILDDVVYVVVEVEVGCRNRHIPGVRPIGDVDVIVWQERFDGAAQTESRNGPKAAPR